MSQVIVAVDSNWVPATCSIDSGFASFAVRDTEVGQYSRTGVVISPAVHGFYVSSGSDRFWFSPTNPDAFKQELDGVPSIESRIRAASTSSNLAAPPGWYPDPQDPQQRRFWDGTAWTDHRAGRPPKDLAQTRRLTWIKTLSIVAAALLGVAAYASYADTRRIAAIPCLPMSSSELARLDPEGSWRGEAPVRILETAKAETVAHPDTVILFVRAASADIPQGKSVFSFALIGADGLLFGADAFTRNYFTHGRLATGVFSFTEEALEGAPRCLGY